MKDIYEVITGEREVAYISGDGRFLIAGDMYEIDSARNLTENGRAEEPHAGARQARREGHDRVQAGEGEGTRITVFTDVECGYCRKLHAQIAQLNDRGVQVRYLAYPRAGPGTDDWPKMEAVWCSIDRKKAITEAKAGKRRRRPRSAPRRSRSSTSWVSSWACAARRRSSPMTANTSVAIWRPIR